MNEIEVHAKNKEDVKLVIIAITELIYKHIPTFFNYTCDRHTYYMYK